MALLLPVRITLAQDSAKGDLNMTVSCLVENNQIPYIVAHVQTKVNRRFRPVAGIPIKLYLNSDSPSNLVRQVITDNEGKATAVIPGVLEGAWGKGNRHGFVALFTGNEKFNTARAEATFSRAKILLDTLPDRKIMVQILENRDSGWAPVKGVDVGVAIKRLGANLNINETATFTTDSTGMAVAEFKRNNIPRDEKGNIVIVARVDDNDQYGNLIVEKALPWGSPFTYQDNFQERSLYATRNKAPLWLLFMSYSMAISVWTVLIWLVLNLFNIKKLGSALVD
jgi:hypothetical protein